jgi:hypothetical protein
MQNQWVRRLMAVFVVLSLTLGLAACGGVKDTTIPPPPGGTDVKEGLNPALDAFIGAVKPALESEVAKDEGQVDKQAVYTTSTPVADVVKFYRDTMKEKGWTESTNKVSPDGSSTSLGYDSGKNAAVVYVSDGSVLGVEGTVVLTINLSKK